MFVYALDLISFELLLGYVVFKEKEEKRNPSDFQLDIKNGSMRSFLYLCCGLKNPTHPYSHTNEKIVHTSVSAAN